MTCSEKTLRFLYTFTYGVYVFKWLNTDRAIAIVSYLLFVPMWSVVTVLLRTESTGVVYAGWGFAIIYLWVMAWFTYLAFFNTSTESTPPDEK